jgi:hypothetical protein
MRMLLNFFLAFCVATVLAQGIIVGLSAARGNIRSETIFKGIALLNGIDITGDQLQRMLDEAREMPLPTYEEVRSARARENLTIELRERSIKQMSDQMVEMRLELETKIADFDLRKEEFYKMLEQKEKNLLDESLKDVQRTLEVLPAEQSKEQIKKLIEAKQLDDVVTIFKEMPLDKRKKIMGEFTSQEEIDILHRILMRTRTGEPASSLIREARSRAPIEE